MADQSPSPKSWRIAEQGFHYADLDIDVRPNGEAYELHIKLGFKKRVVHFDTAGRITHVRFANEPPPSETPRDRDEAEQRTW